MKIAPAILSALAPSRAAQSTTSIAKATLPSAASGNESSSGVAATGGPMTAIPGSIDLQAFFAAWGTASEQFDVTKDGTVDAQDLAIFLGAADGSTPPAPISPQDVINSWGQPGNGGDINGDGLVDGTDLALALGNVQPSASEQLAAGVQKAWGSSDSSYDLNQDGTVDGADLAIALGGGTYAKPSQAGEVEVTDTSATAEVDPVVADAAAKVADSVLATTDENADGAIAASSLPAMDSMLDGVDRDRDGAVSREELVAKLTDRLGTEAAQRPGVDMNALAARWTEALLAPLSPTTLNTAKSTYASTDPQITPVADSIYRRLAANGFERTPPRNLNALVDALVPDRTQRSEVLRGLAQRYSNGLGVNRKA